MVVSVTEVWMYFWICKKIKFLVYFQTLTCWYFFENYKNWNDSGSCYTQRPRSMTEVLPISHLCFCFCSLNKQPAYCCSTVWLLTARRHSRFSSLDAWWQKHQHLCGAYFSPITHHSEKALVNFVLSLQEQLFDFAVFPIHHNFSQTRVRVTFSWSL